MTLHDLAPLIHARRTALGLSQDRLAKLCGLSRATVNQLENGTLVDLGAAKLLALLGLLLLLVPVVWREWPLIKQQLPLMLDRLDTSLRPWLAQWGVDLTLDLGEIKSQLKDYLSANREDWLAPLLSSLKLGGSMALAVAGYAVLVPVVLWL